MMSNVKYSENVLTVCSHEAEENVSLLCSLEHVEVLFPRTISNLVGLKAQCIIPEMLLLLCSASSRNLREGTTDRMKGVARGRQGTSMDPRMCTPSRMLWTPSAPGWPRPPGPDKSSISEYSRLFHT